REDRTTLFTGLTQLAVSRTMDKIGAITEGMTLQEIVEAMAIDEGDTNNKYGDWASYDFQFGPDGKVVEIIKHIHHPTKEPTEGLRRSHRRISSGDRGNNGVRVHAAVFPSRRAR